MLERRNPECQRMEPGYSPCIALWPATPPTLAWQGVRPGSWASPPGAWLDRIARAERQIRERRKHLSTRQNVGRACLRKDLLRIGDIQQVAYAVIVGLERG